MTQATAADDEGDPSDHPSVRAFMAEAAALVAAVDLAAVAAVLAEFPEPEELGMRDDPASIKPHTKPPPKNPVKRAQYLREQIERRRRNAENDIECYNDLRFRGLAALHACDIIISSGRNPLGALRTALDLKSAHITYELTMLHNLHLELAEALREQGLPPQLAIF